MPPTKYNTLKILVIFGCGILGYPLYHAIVKVLSGQLELNITMPILLILIIGLWRLTEWARITITVLVLFISITLPVGIFSPFGAMGEMIDPPPVLELALKIYIPIALSILYVFLLGRYRSEFRKKII